MPILFWDASALARRFVPERGSDSVDAIFAALVTPEMVTTTLGYAETYSILLRKRNRGELPQGVFQSARAVLQREVADNPDFQLLALEDPHIFAGLSLMDRYNINATDAAFLALTLWYRHRLPPGSPACLLVAADRGLLAAARAEGLPTLDPENVAAADVASFLASL